MPGAATKVFPSLVMRAVVAEYIVEALKPATARATTRVRMARVFILRISPWRYMCLKDFEVFLIFLWTNQILTT